MLRLRSKNEKDRSKISKKMNLSIAAIAVFLVVVLILEYAMLQKLLSGGSLERGLPEGHVAPHTLRLVRHESLPSPHQLQDARNANNEDKNTKVHQQMELVEVAKRRGLQGAEDKGPILDILTQAGIAIENQEDLDQETLDRLPTWTHIQESYGSEPKIIGLENCEAFRNAVEPTTRFFGIAGTFNTGTNLAADLLKFNCQITERMEVFGEKSKGVRWQVPWGKHMMARYRESEHTTRTDKDVPKDHVLPVVAIRDPYSWMQSMCRHKYEANWPHTKAHCPNLIATEAEIHRLPLLNKLYGRDGGQDEEKLVPVTIRYNENLRVPHNSLAHYYNEWYNDYLSAKYPRIMVRFEDLLFHGEEVTRKVCECGGGVPVQDNGRSGRFVHVSQSAKKGLTAHGDVSQRTNLIGALIRYGSYTNRTDSMTAEDLAATRRYLDPKLMEVFDYRHPE